MPVTHEAQRGRPKYYTVVVDKKMHVGCHADVGALAFSVFCWFFELRIDGTGPLSRD